MLAAKGAAEIPTAPVPRVGEEEDPAVPAPLEARPQMGFGFQDGAQDEIILEDKPAHFALAVPAQPGLEVPLDFYDKKPRLSLTMLILFCMLSSYRLATTSSRGVARAFLSTPSGNAVRRGGHGAGNLSPGSEG